MAKFWIFGLVIVQLVAVASTAICDAEDALELYPCEELEGDVDINLEIIDNPQLTKINVPNLKQIGKLTITGNPRLIFEKLKSFKNSNITDVDNSIVECLTSEKDVFSSADDLKLCTIIRGPLIIKKAKVTPIGPPFGLPIHTWSNILNIKEVHGCIHVEETGLFDLDFIKEAKVNGCLDHHVITNNSYLCPPLFLEKNSGAEVVVSGSQRPYGCGKVCESLSEGNCNYIKGSFSITSETKREEVAELEMVNGRLSIVDTTLESFEFPKLVEISGAIGPVLIIKNNPNLKSLRMPKIERIRFFDLPAGVPTVQILNNPKLGEDFAIKGVSGCVQTEKHSCYGWGQTRRRKPRDTLPIEWLIIGGVAVLLSAVILVVLGVIICYKKKEEKKEKSLKSDTKTTRKETTSQEERDESKTSTAGTSYSAEQSPE